MSARKFIDAAREFKGARHRHRGRKPWAVDCIGLVVLAGKHAGLEVNDETDYGREPWEDRLVSGCLERFGEPLPPQRARAGDIGIIRWRKEEPSHIGIIGDHPDGGLTLIHAHNVHGVIEQGLTGPVAAALVMVFRPWSDP